MNRYLSLITGIPRSGTTLCCKLINQRADAVALHEPINPGDMPADVTAIEALDLIVSQIKQLDHAIEHGQPFTHGDKGGLTLDNPVGQSLIGGVRQVVAQRGQIQLPAREKNSYSLVVKQNALFTALMPELALRYPMVCIVRNPVDVLLSWFTVDLPVNRGHIPAGERFDAKLKAALSEPDCLTRQLIIYQWFMQSFINRGLPIVRYEDVIVSNGVALDTALGLEPFERGALSTQERVFDDNVLQTLANAAGYLTKLDCGELYSQADIKQSLKNKGL